MELADAYKDSKTGPFISLALFCALRLVCLLDLDRFLPGLARPLSDPISVYHFVTVTVIANLTPA